MYTTTPVDEVGSVEALDEKSMYPGSLIDSKLFRRSSPLPYASTLLVSKLVLLAV